MISILTPHWSYPLIFSINMPHYILSWKKSCSVFQWFAFFNDLRLSKFRFTRDRNLWHFLKFSFYTILWGIVNLKCFYAKSENARRLDGFSLFVAFLLQERNKCCSNSKNDRCYLLRWCHISDFLRSKVDILIWKTSKVSAGLQSWMMTNKKRWN